MSGNMLGLLENIHVDGGIIVNNLIKSGVFTRREIVDASIESNIPYLIYCTARYVKRLSKKNVEELADALIKSKNIKYIYDFAVNVKSAPIDKLSDIIIELGTAENIYNFAKEVGNVPIDKLVDAIIAKGNSEFIYKLININNVSLSILVDALIALKDGWYLCQIANTTNDENIKNKILNAILYEFKNGKDVYNYAKIVNDAPIDRLADSIITIGNPEYIYKFASDIGGASVNKLADAIIHINNAEYIYFFARGVVGAPIDKLADALITTKEVTYMDLFMHIEGAPVEKLKIMKNRFIVEAMTDEEKIEYLLRLAQNNEINTIKYCSDIYRNLFVEVSSFKSKIRKKN